MRSFVARRALFVSITFIFAASPLARAETWTGLASPDNNWTTVGNWDTGVPVSGSTAVFNSTGNGNTTISLGGASQPLSTVQFDPGAAAYSIGQLSGDALNFDSGGFIIANTNLATAQTINAAVQTNGALQVINGASNGVTTGNGLIALTIGPISIGGGGTFTVNNPIANATTQLNGAIADGTGGAGALFLSAGTTGSSNDNNFIINGTNTYTGGTTITVNTGSAGSIQIGSDSPFGTGKIINNLVGNSAQWSALGGARTIGNTFDLNGGLTFVGSNSFVFTGPTTIIQPTVGGSRTLNNLIAAAGTSVTYGASPGSTTITLGNPVSNGGDGVGKILIFSNAANSTTVINAVMQDPAAGGGTAGGTVQYSGTLGGVVQVNSLNTYSGMTNLNSNTTIQFNHSYNAGDPSGPFGVGILHPNNSNNNILQPVGGDRTIANPILMTTGFTVANSTGDTSSVTFTGPITMETSGRTLQNNFPATGGGTLTLGAAGSPSTWTFPTNAGQTVVIAGTGPTVINDVIQDPSPSISANVTVTATGSLTLNALNTFKGNTLLSGAGLIIPITVSSNALPGASFTAGPFGTGTVTPNSSTNQHFRPTGGNRSISNAITMNFGFAMDNIPGDTYNMTFAGPILMTNNNGRTISNGFSTFTAPGGTMFIGDSTAPKTLTLGNWTSGATQPALSFASWAGPIVVNDTIVDPTGLTQPYKIQINPTAGQNSNVTFNAANTYTGPTTVSFGSLIAANTTGSATGTGAVTVNAGATIGGTGKIGGALTNNGTIAPGLPAGAPATLAVGNNVIDGAGATWAIDLSGVAADILAVTGNLDLTAADTLAISGAGTGSSWVIATYTGALTGTFDTITSGYTVNYGTGTNSQITLNAVAAGLPGDFNSDGKVDAGDYVTWRKNDGTNNALANDNGLGTPIGQSHYDLWRANFGNPPGAGSGSGWRGGSVPEPGTMALFIAGLMALVCPRRLLRSCNG